MAARLVFAVALLVSSPAAAQTASSPGSASSPDPAHPRLAAFGGLGYLGSPGTSGAVLSGGVRLALGRHWALGFDLGYGVVGGSAVEDRWWLMPTVAAVLPAGPVRVDVGAGAGLGAASGYASWSGYVAAPFGPAWAFQLVPALRVHALVAKPLSSKVDVYARVDAATLILGGNSIGSRVGNPRPGIMDTVWYALSVGVEVDVL